MWTKVFVSLLLVVRLVDASACNSIASNYIFAICADLRGFVFDWTGRQMLVVVAPANKVIAYKAALAADNRHATLAPHEHDLSVMLPNIHRVVGKDMSSANLRYISSAFEGPNRYLYIASGDDNHVQAFLETPNTTIMTSWESRSFRKYYNLATNNDLRQKYGHINGNHLVLVDVINANGFTKRETDFNVWQKISQPTSILFQLNGESVPKDGTYRMLNISHYRHGFLVKNLVTLFRSSKHASMPEVVQFEATFSPNRMGTMSIFLFQEFFRLPRSPKSSSRLRRPPPPSSSLSSSSSTPTESSFVFWFLFLSSLVILLLAIIIILINIQFCCKSPHRRRPRRRPRPPSATSTTNTNIMTKKSATKGTTFHRQRPWSRPRPRSWKEATKETTTKRTSSPRHSPKKQTRLRDTSRLTRK